MLCCQYVNMAEGETLMENRKNFTWLDYDKSHRETVESWFDSEAVKYTGCDDGWDSYFEYWKQEPETVLNENFFGKVIFDEEAAIGILSIFKEDDVHYIQEFIISPDRRGRGIGSGVLRELLQNGENIIGQPIKNAEACIFLNNIASQRAFEKAGFQYSHAHPDGDAWYYVYRKNGE